MATAGPEPELDRVKAGADAVELRRDGLLLSGFFEATAARLD